MTMESLPNFEEIDIQKYLQVLQRRWLPVVGIFGIAVSLGSLYAFSLKPSYKAEGSLMIKTNRTSSLTGLTQEIGRLEALNQNENPLETQVKIVASNPVLQETIHLLNLKNAKGNPLPIRDFAAKLKVEGIKGSDVVQITYGDNNPELASKAVNTVIDTYIKQNVQANQDEALTVKKFIEMQLPKAEGTVRRAESELREFKEKNKVIVLDQEANAAVDTISKLNSQVSQAQAQLDDVNGRLEQLRKEAQVNSQQGVIASELSQAPGVQKVLAQLQEAESQLTLERTRFQAGHPSVTNLEEKVAALRSLLQERTGQVAGEAQVTQGSLQIGQLRQGLIADITRAEAQRVGLERQIITLSQQSEAYRQRASYLPRLEQFQRELDALLPDKPEGPRKLLFVVGGGGIGLFLGIIAAFGLDLMDRSVKTVKEAKEVMRYTLLGIIPGLNINGKNHYSVTGLSKSLPRIIGRDIPQFPFGDAYQILQANLKFLCSDKPLKSIVVSSSVAKEGKSEVAANLAVAMAQIGRRVLLVDADMRHPIQHHIWELTNAVGLSNIIVDQVSLNAAVQEVLPNLYVLSSGVLPPNPMALLDSQRMAILINSFARDYDFVIFDTPALSGTADAAVLSNLTDGMLLVVRPGVVNLDSANAAKEFLIQSGQKVLGIVINGVNVKREPDSYFYYTKDAIETAITSNNNSSLMKEVDSR
jgi:polysaccharide biosynthesis transport protein